MYKCPYVISVKVGSAPSGGDLLEKDHLESGKSVISPEIDEQVQCFLWAQAAEVPKCSVATSS